MKYSKLQIDFRVLLVADYNLKNHVQKYLTVNKMQFVQILLSHQCLY